MNALFSKNVFLILISISLFGCAGNRQHSLGDNNNHKHRLDILKRAIQLPWNDDGSCVVREAPNEWTAVVERCFYALDLQKIRFEASTGRCAAYSEDVTALGTCLLAAVPALETSEALARMAGPPIAAFPAVVASAAVVPIMIVAGVIVTGVILAYYIAKATTETIHALQRSSPAFKTKPEPNLKPETSTKKRRLPDLIVTENDPKTEENKEEGRIYVTYLKFNEKTNRLYAGRTSMVTDLNRCTRDQAEEAVQERDKNHHKEDENPEPKAPTFTVARVDKFACGKAVNYKLRYSDQAYSQIRGREQMLIDAYGGAWSDTGKPHKTENKIRAVSKDNKNGRKFHEAAKMQWPEEINGKTIEYTGDN